MEHLNVLIVDDEPGMRLGAARALKGAVMEVEELGATVGFQSATVDSGEGALAQLRGGQVDLMLLDYKLPDMTGLDVMDQVRAEHLEVLTIIITAYASIEVAISTTRNGAFDFLAKPFTPEDLRNVVRKASVHLLANRRARALELEKRRVRFEFISVLAHELKSPLAAVEGYLQMMRRRTVGDDIGSYDHAIERSLGRLAGMRRMIADLLEMTRIESGEMERRLVPLDVVKCASAAIEDVSVEAKQRDIAIELHAPGPLFFVADDTELAIVLNNLLSNAVKYNRDRGRVDVFVGEAGGALLIEVRDTGLGMSPSEKKQLFKEFSRIRNAETADIPGSGLGLSILKKIVRLYGGTVTVVSEPGAGTTFTVSLKPEIQKQ
jgi:two-component system, sensor histidine kinase and response regulator